MCGVLVVTAFGLTGCKGATDAEKRVREALRNTEKLSNTFLYKETVYDNAGKHETDVRGLVEDDFRYKARVATDGKPVLDEVVSDDALAVRFLDPASMGSLVSKREREPFFVLRRIGHLGELVEETVSPEQACIHGDGC